MLKSFNTGTDENKKPGFQPNTQRTLIRSFLWKEFLNYIKRSLTSNPRQTYFLLPSPFESRTSKQPYFKLCYLLPSPTISLNCSPARPFPDIHQLQKTPYPPTICYKAGFRAAVLHLHHQSPPSVCLGLLVYNLVVQTSMHTATWQQKSESCFHAILKAFQK